MSNAVTDTHALIWYLEDSPRLSSVANQALNNAIAVKLLFIFQPSV